MEPLDDFFLFGLTTSEDLVEDGVVEDEGETTTSRYPCGGAMGELHHNKETLMKTLQGSQNPSSSYVM